LLKERSLALIHKLQHYETVRKFAH